MSSDIPSLFLGDSVLFQKFWVPSNNKHNDYTNMGSSIEPTNNEEGANPVADGGCWRTVTTEAAEQQARATVVRDNKEKIMGGGKKIHRSIS